MYLLHLWGPVMNLAHGRCPKSVHWPGDWIYGRSQIEGAAWERGEQGSPAAILKRHVLPYNHPDPKPATPELLVRDKLKSPAELVSLYPRSFRAPLFLPPPSFPLQCHTIPPFQLCHPGTDPTLEDGTGQRSVHSFISALPSYPFSSFKGVALFAKG